MTTYRQDTDFKDLIQAAISDNILSEAISFIKRNFEPSDVFDDNKLEDWAKNNGFVKEE